MKINKRVGAAVTASALALGLLTAPLENIPLSADYRVSAVEKFNNITAQTVSAETGGLPDSRELEQMYIDSLFYGGGISTYMVDYGASQLTGAQLELYNRLKAHISDIAGGNKNDTTLTLTRSENVQLTGTTEAELKAQIGEKCNSFTADVSAAFNYLLYDMPMDFYWYDKTPNGGMNQLALGSYDGTVLDITNTVTFTVSQGYRSGNSTTVDTAKINTAKTAVENAQAIADANAGKSDYEKVLAFCDEICKLTDYNNGALAEGTAYGDPWQLVYVFDKNASTNVVCEGYSKAFQYLCDLSNVKCYTVTGTMTGGTGAGPHMWNIVVLDGVSYLVDVTNSDSGSVGQEGELLLMGAAESDGTGCTFTSTSPNMTYTYDEETLALYPSGILTVSTKDYVPDASVGEITISVTPGDLEISVGDEADLIVEVTSEEEISGYLTCTYDPDIVSVSDGAESEDGTGTVYTVTGIAEGIATLTFEWTSDEIEPDEPCTVTCTVTVTAAECEHEWSEKWENDADGHWQICEICGDESEKEDHNMAEAAGTAKEPTCTEAGKEADMECSDCGYTEYGKVIPAKDHTPGKPKQENVKDASCTAAGSYDEVVRCEVCDEIISSVHKDGEMLPHDMAEVEDSAKEPTCAEAGKEADKKCSVCGHEETGEEIPATGKHTMTEIPDTAKEPTCAEAGKEADMECSVCGLKETGEEIPATGEHTAGEPERINEVAATCYQEGSYDEVVKCTVCRKELSKESKTIEKTDHTPGEPTEENTVAPSCTKNGSYDLVTKCTVAECGEVITTEHVVVPAEGHEFGALIPGETTHYQECAKCHDKVGEESHTEDSGTVTVRPTETDDGARTYKCSVCGKELRTESVPALGENHEHSYTIKNSDASSHWNECVCGEADETTRTLHTTDTKEEIALEAVCNVDGLKYVITYCTVCDKEISRDSEAIPKTGVHNAGTDYGYDSTDHWQTCTVCGTVMNKAPHTAGPAATETTPQTCTVCGYEMAPVIAHTHTFAATWTSDDSFHWHAATCQHTEEVSGKAVHVWDGGVVPTQPTETSKGVKTFTCTVCAATKTEPVSELAHTHTPSDAWRFDITGHWHVCGSCDEKLNFAAHNEISEVTKAPTATVPGTRRYYCSICRYVIREEDIPATGVTVEPVYPSYPSGGAIVFPAVSTKEPILDNGSGKTGWESIADDIRNAGNGDAVYVNMNGTTTLSKTALKELAGKNVDLVLEMSDKITWIINGETVEKATDVNMRARLNTNNIPDSVIEKVSGGNSVVQLSLSHSGSFGFDAVMTVALGTRYNGMFANLLYYNPKTKELEFVDCSTISNGKAVLNFSHASDYAIVIGSEPMGDYEDVSAASGIYENESSASGESGIYAAVTAVLAVSAAVVIFRKRVRK